MFEPPVEIVQILLSCIGREVVVVDGDELSGSRAAMVAWLLVLSQGFVNISSSLDKKLASHAVDHEMIAFLQPDMATGIELDQCVLEERKRVPGNRFPQVLVDPCIRCRNWIRRLREVDLFDEVIGKVHHALIDRVTFHSEADAQCIGFVDHQSNGLDKCRDIELAMEGHRKTDICDWLARQIELL